MKRWETLGMALVVLAIIGTPIAVFAGQRYLNTNPHEYTIVAHIAEDGGFVPSQITVTQGQPVRLRLTSADVTHGFAVPGLGIQNTQLYPGKYVTINFTPAKPGAYPFMCTIVCSPLHYKMHGAIVVVPASGSDNEPTAQAAATPAEQPMQMPGMGPGQSTPEVGPTESSLRGIPASSPAATATAPRASAADIAVGQTAYRSYCASCHGANAAGGIKLGSATSADLRWNHLGPMYHDDPALIRRAILTGKDEAGKDLNPVMPHWQGQLTDEQVNAIIAYLKTTGK